MARKSRRNHILEGAIGENTRAKVYPTAIYVRLSVENLGRDDGGASIANQAEICREYIKGCPDLKLVRVYEDNGWSGTVMRRPAFEELMEDVKDGVIKAIVVRDLSRFARNYIEAGTYLEKIFPDLGVRFISVREQLDTLVAKDAAESLVVPLQNLINDLYAKDISRKVGAAYAVRMREGTLRWVSVPYGYKKNAEHTSIVPDELRADVLRKIFEWKAEGQTSNEIARRLNKANAPKADVSYSQGKPWCIQAIRVILRNPVYIGIRILGKSHRALYKGIKKEKTPPEAWHIFYDSHEPLISRELFDKVQSIMDEDARKRHDSMRETAANRSKMHNLFEGKIFCGDCGQPMYYSRHRHNLKDCVSWYGRYLCKNYQDRYIEHRCTSHYINQRKLEEKVLAVVQVHVKIALDYKSLIDRFQGSAEDMANRRKHNAAVHEEMKKLDSLQRKRSKLYEDYVKGILDAEEYQFAKTSYTEEYDACYKRMNELMARREAYRTAISSNKGRTIHAKPMNKAFIQNWRRFARRFVMRSP